MPEDSDLSSQKQKQKPASPPKSTTLPKEKSILQSQPSQIVRPPIKIQQPPPPLQQQNRKLRRKLKELSIRLDEQLQRAAQNRLKYKQDKGHPVSLESQSQELQNAYKMIQRLQRTVKEYEGKEAYQVTLKRVMDLEGIIKKKDVELEQLRTQIKTQKKIIKEKEKHVQELIQNSKKMGNPTQDLQTINKLKLKMKKLLQQNQLLRKKQLQKHQKLVKAERKLVQMQQNDRQIPIASDQNLLKQVQEQKDKYKQAIQRIQRQNIYISKLNEKLNQNSASQRSGRLTQAQRQRKSISVSLEDLPQLKKKILPADFLDHLPTQQGSKIRRY